MRQSSTAQDKLRVVSVATLSAIFIVIAACSDDEPAPAATRSAGTSGTPAATALPPDCETSAPASPRGKTIFDTLADGASTLGDFHPSFNTKVTDASAGAGADVTYELSLSEDQPDFQAFFITIPDEWSITPGCALPLGTKVESLRWLTTLGLINAPCNSVVPLEFAMQNASTDPAEMIAFVDDDGNLVDGFEKDRDNSGLPDVVEKYPNLLDRVFAGRKPIRRAVGIATIAGIPVIAQSLIFSPLDEIAGQTLVILFQDFPTARTTVSRTVITDQCTPFSLTLTEFGMAGGQALQSNPSAGQYTFAMTAFGLRDADGDGIENALDSCPFDMNVGHPGVAGDGDADMDGLDAACDPNDLLANTDQDGDLTPNRGDLCPLVPGLDRSGAQKDSDLDQIGDECDVFGKGPSAGDGDVVASAVAADITIR